MTISRLLLAFLGAGAVIGAPMLASGAVVLDNAYLDAQSSATVANPSNSKARTKDHSKHYTSLTKLEAGVGQSGNSSVSVNGASAAGASDTFSTFSSASEGSYGFLQSVMAETSKDSATASGEAGGEFAYTFNLTGKTSLYDITLTGADPDGNFETTLYDLTTGTFVGITETADFTETLSDLSKGKYQLVTIDDPNISAAAGVGAGSASAGGNFSFDISAVPEPATWAMMLFGVSLVGAGLRMSRKTPLLTAA